MAGHSFSVRGVCGKSSPGRFPTFDRYEFLCNNGLVIACACLFVFVEVIGKVHVYK